MPYTYPSLTPYYGLGSYGRTGAAVIISSPRNKIGSQGRIYAYMKSHGQGPQYINFLLSVLPRGNSNPRNAFSLIGF
jgi:hypothetical protein